LTEFSADEARNDGINSDFVDRQIGGQKSSHVQEGRIVNAVKKCGTPNRNSRTSGHIDYATCAVVRYQVNCLSDQTQRSDGFDVDRSGPLFVRPFDLAIRANDRRRCVVDDDVENTERSEAGQMCHRGFQRVRICDVSLQADDGCACLTCDLPRRSQNLAFGTGEKGNIYALSCESAPDALAYSFAAPADQCGPAREPSFHDIPPIVSIMIRSTTVSISVRHNVKCRDVRFSRHYQVMAHTWSPTHAMPLNDPLATLPLKTFDRRCDVPKNHL
jgi:hypothetical protein